MSRFGATILDAEGLRLTAEEKVFFRQARPFGFILFSRNIDSPDQVRALCDEMRSAAGHDALITIDQEGGRVQRLRAPFWREWSPPLDQTQAAGEDALRVMFLRYRLIAAELKALGIDSNCAPLVDIAGESTHPFLRDRCYGSDPARVAHIGRAVAEGLLEGGVLPVLKHIPGHGRARSDSHHALPVIETALDELGKTDFEPFHALNDLPLGMTAHIVYAAIDTAPATLSPKVMKFIREEIGFDGLIMTDDISMKALNGTLSALAHGALDAGCDVILHCNGSLAEREEVAFAAGEMTAVAQARAERALARRKRPEPIDISAVEEQLHALTDGRRHG